MLVHKAAKVEKAASKDQTRPVLTNLYLRAGADGATLEATDSYMLVRVPVELEEGDTEGFVPASALTEARKGAGRYSDTVSIAANGSIGYRTKEGASVSLERTEPGKFPDTDALFPAELAEFEFGVNPALLLAAAEAMGSQGGVRIKFARKRDSSSELEADPLRPMLVRPLNTCGKVDGAEAIVMPIRLAG